MPDEDPGPDSRTVGTASGGLWERGHCHAQANANANPNAGSAADGHSGAYGGANTHR
jgi:hypothetical protein